MSSRLPGDRGPCTVCGRRQVRLSPEGALLPHRYMGTPGLLTPGQPCPGAGTIPTPEPEEQP